MDREEAKAERFYEASGGHYYPFSHRFYRALWNVTWALLASWTPPPMRAWRRLLLRAFGAKMASTANVRGKARIWYPKNLEMLDHASVDDHVFLYNVSPLTLGRYVDVSQGAFLCGGSHDYTRASNPIIARPTVIGDRAWICVDAFVGHGVTVPEGCVVGARAVVTRSLEAWTVYAGNPAKPIRKRHFDPGR